MCQNTNLSGSTGGVAEDLRREIHRMILRECLTKKSSNLCLKGTVIYILQTAFASRDDSPWFGPLLFLIIGGFIAYGIFRRANSVDRVTVDLDEEQEAKLNELVK